MTDKEIKRMEKEVPLFKDGIPCELTIEQKQIRKELDCRKMINSCLCYGYDFLKSRYIKSYIEEIGKERVLELYNEQKADFAKAIVSHDVYQDSEGVSYNSIKWADELDGNIENEINY